MKQVARRSTAVPCGIRIAGLVIAFEAMTGCDRRADERLDVGQPGADGSRSVASSPTPSTTQWLTDITEQAGLSFVHETGADGQLLMPEIMGSGGAMFDFDNDGDLDIYLINGDRSRAGDGAQRSTSTANRLYRQDPDLTFVDVTASARLEGSAYGMGVAIGDIDNDGDLDLYESNFGPDQLHRNNGDGTFDNITAHAGINVNGWSASATFVDYDCDGWLDLYVTRYLHYEPSKKCADGTGRPDYCSPSAFPPQNDVLLRNNGDGTFSDVSEAAGITRITGHGLGVVCEDFNSDGWPDVLVANDGDANQLWINQRDGTFRDQAVMLGIAFNPHGRAEAGMGVVAADFDNDGRSEVFVTHLRGEVNRLYRRASDAPYFDEVSASCGLTACGLRYTGFGAVAVDLECDGDLDIALVNGRVARGPLEAGAALPPEPWDAYAERNLVFLNDGLGRFVSGGHTCAAFCDPAEISKALVAGDIDNDGDLDLLVTNTQGPARLYRNDAPRAGQWLMVRAIDPRFNRDAIGATVRVECGNRSFHRTIAAGYSYLASNDLRAHFGLGAVSAIDRLEVHWPDGLREVFPSPAINTLVELRRGSGATPP